MRVLLILCVGGFLAFTSPLPSFAEISQADRCMNYLREGDTLQAGKCINKMLGQLNRKKPSVEAAHTYRVAANYYVEKGNFKLAIKYYDSAYLMAGSLDNQKKNELTAQIDFSRSLLFYRYGEYDIAVKLSLGAYQYFRTNEQSAGAAEAANRLGGLYLVLGDSAKSANFCREAYTQSLKSADSRIQQICFIALGNYLSSIGKSDSAILIFNQTIEMAKTGRNLKLISDAYYNLAFNYSLNEKYAQALENIKLAHAWALKSYNAYDICDTRYKTGLILYYLKHYDVAADTLLSALREAKNLQSIVLQRNIYDVLSFLESERGNAVKALEYLNLYIDFNHKVMSASEQQQLNFLNARYDAEKRESDILRQQAQLQRRNFIILLATIILLALLITLVLVVIINRHKRKISRQQLTIHQQKIGELEKEKEIVSMQSLLRGEESERGRIARDLHDGLGGMLSGVKLTLNNMSGKHTLDDEDVNKFEKAINLIDQSVKELRNVAHNMMPEILMQQGVDVALRNFCESLTEPPQVIYQYFGSRFRYDSGFELTVYRIAQELVNNALKHAKAKEVVVELIQQQERLSLNVRDDGQGFDAKTNNFGQGLLNLHARVAGYQGIIDISSMKNKGTEVNVSFEHISHLIKK
ncbi:MAG: sensor histidine kinase [Lentimicrobiaceae bacterium]|nr:sensor histidine kinase [Lentimicrobiaceae bacterium]